MPFSPSRTRAVYYTSFATDFAYFAFLFSITRWLAESGSSQWHLGIFGACASISYALCGPLAGIVSDRFGRRRVMLCGAVATIAVLLACSVWRSRPLLYIMAAACGFSVSLIFPPLIAWLTDDGQDTNRRLFLFCISWNAGVIASQSTAGWFYWIRPELPLLVAAIPMVGIIAVMSAWKPPDTQRAAPLSSEPERTEPRARTFVYLGWLSNGAGALAFSMVTHLFPYLAHESGISPPAHGAMLAANRLAVIGTYFLMYRFTFWHYRLWPAIGAQVIAMAGLAILGYASSIPVLTIGLILTALMLGYNYFASIYYSTMAFGSRRKGIASGIHEGSLAVGGAIGALGGGLIGTAYGARVPYRVCVVLLGSFVVLQSVIRLVISRRGALDRTSAR